MWQIYLVMVISFGLTGCASGTFNYTPPKTEQLKIENQKIVEKSFSKVWDQAMEQISQTAFSIDHINKESGFISINFSEINPEKYLDCGTYDIEFSNLRGEQKINFQGAESNKSYNVMDGNQVVQIVRNTKLSGKINLYIKESEKNKSLVRVNVKYILTVFGANSQMGNDYRWYPRDFSYSLDLSTGEAGRASEGQRKTQCIANGSLEKQILTLVSDR